MTGMTSGRTAYEAYRTRIADLRARYAGTGFPSAAPQPWDRLSGDLQDGWETGVQAANEPLREQLADLRDHIDSLARGLDMAARSTAPSEKSEIERGCASALRGLLRIDGESDDATRQRLEAERAPAAVPEFRVAACTLDGHDAEHLLVHTGDAWLCGEQLAEMVAKAGVLLRDSEQTEADSLRYLVAEILGHFGPHCADQDCETHEAETNRYQIATWRQRAGLEG
jgi:hypothetical protein